MLQNIFKLAILGVLIFALQHSVDAQDKKRKNTAEKTLSAAKKVTFVVVGESAKLTYKATKFSAGKVAKPIIVKAAPKTTKFALVQTGKAAKTTLPVVKTLLIKYVKYKLFL